MGKYSSSHTVYKNDKGIEVPSVTTIMKMLANQNLIGWSNYIGLQGIKYDEFINIAANIGTLTHKYIEDYLNGILRLEYRMRDEVERKAFLAYTNFRRYYSEYGRDLEIIETEKKMVADDYAGTIDLICKYKGKDRILDFKTSSGVYDSQFLQLGGYINLVESTGGNVDEVAILAVNKGKLGKYIIEVKSREEMQKYVDSFMKLKEFFYLWYDISN